MARPGLDENRKFRLLVGMLKMPRPHVRGHLEMMWDSCNQDGNPVFENADFVEAAAEWGGGKGAWADALVTCGFLDRDGERFIIHDFAENAPEYVRARWRKQQERKRKATMSRDSHVTVTPMSHTPAPAPAPAPAPEEDLGRRPKKPVNGRGGRPDCVSAVLQNVGLGDSGDYREQTLKRLQAVTGDDAEYQHWWAIAFDALGAAGRDEFERWLRYAEDCANPVTRRAKDLGALEAPGRFLCKKILEWARKNGVRLPALPKAAAAGRGD